MDTRLGMDICTWTLGSELGQGLGTRSGDFPRRWLGSARPLCALLSTRAGRQGLGARAVRSASGDEEVRASIRFAFARRSLQAQTARCRCAEPWHSPTVPVFVGEKRSCGEKTLQIKRKSVFLGGGTQRSLLVRPSPFPSALIQRGDSWLPLPRVE